MSTSTMEKTDITTITRQRSDIYGFLAMVYRQEASSDFLEQIKDPQFLGPYLIWEFNLMMIFFLNRRKNCSKIYP